MSTSPPNLPSGSVLAGLLADAQAEQAQSPPPATGNNYNPTRDPYVQEELKSMRNIARALLSREHEGLKLYDPLPEGVRFHKSKARIRICAGGNRSSKSTAAFAECAFAVTGTHPYRNYPKTNGRAVLVGYDELRIAQVMYRKLFKPGAFQVIKDEHTKRWRPFVPDQPYDAAYAEKKKDAPPLIPDRLVKDESWRSKKDDNPRLIKLHTGWEMMFFPSGSAPPAGIDVDVVLFDEEIIGASWLPEMQSRIIDRRGCLFWSCTPQQGTQQLYELQCAANEDLLSDKPRVQEFRFLIKDNKYIAEAAKQEFYADMTSPEEYAVRVEGRSSLLGALVFPEWNDDLLVEEFAIPPDWTIWYAVDPGRQVCSVEFLAVPPPRWIKRNPTKRKLYIFDELYMKQCTAKIFGRGVASKIKRRTPYAAIIDYQEARKADTGTGLNIELQYSKALSKNKVRARATGFGFIHGSTDTVARIESAREWLAHDEHGRPQIGVFRRCRNLDREMRVYQYEVRRKRGHANYIDDRKPVKKNDHAVDCLLYLLAAAPSWKPVPKKKQAETNPMLEGMARLNRWCDAREPNAKPASNFLNMGPKV